MTLSVTRVVELSWVFESVGLAWRSKLDSFGRPIRDVWEL